MAARLALAALGLLSRTVAIRIRLSLSSPRVQPSRQHPDTVSFPLRPLPSRDRPDLSPADDRGCPIVKPKHQPPECLYGSVKMWEHHRRQGITVAKCTMERLMRVNGWRGVTRGRTAPTTIPDPGYTPGLRTW